MPGMVRPDYNTRLFKVSLGTLSFKNPCHLPADTVSHRNRTWKIFDNFSYIVVIADLIFFGKGNTFFDRNGAEVDRDPAQSGRTGLLALHLVDTKRHDRESSEEFLTGLRLPIVPRVGWGYASRLARRTQVSS